MNIGMVGLGKLGFPVAVGIAAKGHTVYGHDLNKDAIVDFNYGNEGGPDSQTSFEKFYEANGDNIHFVDLETLCVSSDIIFIAVQTPHEAKYEGVTRIPNDRKDFDYKYLFNAIRDIEYWLEKPTPVVVISTVLPGSLRNYLEEWRPCLNKDKNNLILSFNPYFIAMGTVIKDFYDPEFVLIGSDYGAPEIIEKFYKTIHNKPVINMSIESAELTKVAYNTFIGMKIAFANTLMEICHKIPNASVDDVTNALKQATDRLISPKYLTAGMGDGGGCHPRDNIAMSWLAQKLNLSHNLFDDVMKAREDQTDWLAKLICGYSTIKTLPVCILGYAFKANNNLTTGSPAILLKNLVEEKGVPVTMCDPHINCWHHNKPAVYFIGTKHDVLQEVKFPKGSVVIDPFRYIPYQEGVEVVRIGEHK